MKKFYFIVAAVILLGLIFVFVNQSKMGKSSNKFQVTASFYPLYFFASAVGGDKAQVNNITPAGSEPHDYDPYMLFI